MELIEKYVDRGLELFIKADNWISSFTDDNDKNSPVQKDVFVSSPENSSDETKNAANFPWWAFPTAAILMSLRDGTGKNTEGEAKIAGQRAALLGVMQNVEPEVVVLGVGDHVKHMEGIEGVSDLSDPDAETLRRGPRNLSKAGQRFTSDPILAGYELLNHGNTTLAAIQFSRAVGYYESTNQPVKQYESLLRTAEAMFNVGYPRSGIDHLYKQARQIAPSIIANQWTTGIDALNNGDFEEAVDAFRNAKDTIADIWKIPVFSEKTPKTAITHANFGIEVELRNLLIETQKKLDFAIQGIEALHRAGISFEEARPSDVREGLTEAAENFKEAGAKTRTSLIYFTLGEMEYDNDNYEQAISALNNGLALTTSVDSDTLRANRLRVETLLKMGEITKAISYIRWHIAYQPNDRGILELIDLIPDDLATNDIRELRAVKAMVGQNYELAATLFKKAAAEHDEPANKYYALMGQAEALAKAGKSEAEVQNIHDAIYELVEQSTHSKWLEGTSLIESGRVDDGSELLQDATILVREASLLAPVGGDLQSRIMSLEKGLVAQHQTALQAISAESIAYESAVKNNFTGSADAFANAAKHYTNLGLSSRAVLMYEFAAATYTKFHTMDGHRKTLETIEAGLTLDPNNETLLGHKKPLVDNLRAQSRKYKSLAVKNMRDSDSAKAIEYFLRSVDLSIMVEDYRAAEQTLDFAFRELEDISKLSQLLGAKAELLTIMGHDSLNKGNLAEDGRKSYIEATRYFEDAIGIFEDLMKKRGNLETVEDHLRTLSINREDAYLGMAEALLRSGDASRALTIIEQSLKAEALIQQTGSEFTELAVRAQELAGDALWTIGRADEAVQRYRLALESSRLLADHVTVELHEKIKIAIKGSKPATVAVAGKKESERPVEIRIAGKPVDVSLKDRTPRSSGNLDPKLVRLVHNLAIGDRRNIEEFLMRLNEKLAKKGIGRITAEDLASALSGNNPTLRREVCDYFDRRIPSGEVELVITRLQEYERGLTRGDVERAEKGRRRDTLRRGK